jgi:DNA-binding transcriptional LysR family regulator
VDRLEAWTIFVAVAERGSFVDAARHLGRSPAAVTRAVAALEHHLSSRLLNRTTRSVALTDAGARYLDGCRRILSEFEELEASATGERQQPRGLLNVTAPVMFGRLHVFPIVSGFLGKYPDVDVRLLLLDRVVSLVDEGLDVGIRLGHLPVRRCGRSGSGTSAARFTPAPIILRGTGRRRHPRTLEITDASLAAPSLRSRIAGRSSASSAASPSP